MRLIDAAMMETGMLETGLLETGLLETGLAQGDPAGSADIFVLDDVTPRYATANAALNACRAGLGHALQCLSESGSPA